MLTSLSWLKKYVEIPVSVEPLVNDLTMAGLNVERVIERGYSDPNVVVGRVREAKRHPNADKLSVCQVEVGPERIHNIVCGAPNVAEGQLVLVALPGAKLPDGTKIRKSKIRGEKSEGMICSETELGLGTDSAGIMVLEGDYVPGAPISEVLGDPDQVLEIEVTPNRPDLLSHIGVAREISAIYQVPLQEPNVTMREGGKTDFTVSIDDSGDCRRYVGKRVSGVRVGPSPPWLASALEGVGLHSVNNVVDASNFVMMELGQPIHAFDLKTLRGAEIVVRRARAGEKLLALDGNTYELDPGELAIADAKDVVALAGVIGGEETGVHDDTQEILIESANFDPVLIRKMRKKLNIPTDASYRFERGVDRELCRVAAERAAELVCEVAGGDAGSFIDVYPVPATPVEVTIRRPATERLLGVRLKTDEIGELLGRLGFESAGKAEDSVTVVTPSYRLDIVEEADLIEEVARLYGYDRIGKGWAYRCTTFAVPEPFDAFSDEVSSHMASRGFVEVVASSFSDGSELQDFDWPADDPRQNPIPISNPLNVNHRYLKTSVIPGMLDIVRRNLDYDVRRLRMYQIDRVFLSLEGHAQLPEERNTLGIVISLPDSVHFWNHMSKPVDLFDIKREIEILIDGLAIDLPPDIDYTFDNSVGQFAYSVDSKTLIEGGIVNEVIGSRYDFEQPVWWATLDLNELYRRRAPSIRFKRLPEYPVSRRDLSLVAGRGVQFDQIEKSLVKSAGTLLESLQVFDIYAGDKLGNDRTAYGVRLDFRSADRTLTDDEVDQVIEKIVSNLEKQFDVELRK